MAVVSVRCRVRWVPRDRPHPRADRVHRRHRAQGLHVRTSDGVYFDTSKQDDYGYLARLDIHGLEAGKRVELGEKRLPTDFALWKFSKPEEKRQMEWDSPWGRGFPGWHIECSAMAQKYLGDYFDIHCGGEDHIPVHHTNEIAQTEARVGTRLANFWMHGYFLLLNDAKMAKSAGEFLRVQSLIERGYDPLVYRYLCLTAHYRTQMSFSWEAMDAAATALDRMRNGFFALPADPLAQRRCGVSRAIHGRDRTTTSTCRARSPSRGRCCAATCRRRSSARRCSRFDDVLGLRLAQWEPRRKTVPAEVKALAEARAAARKAKQWAEADRLRGELAAARLGDGRPAARLSAEEACRLGTPTPSGAVWRSSPRPFRPRVRRLRRSRFAPFRRIVIEGVTAPA